MDILRKIFKDEKKPFHTNLAIMAAVGIILLIVSKTIFSGNDSKAADITPPTQAEESYSDGDTYELRLEKRLEELLKTVDGVGTVNVMLTVSYSSEIILAEDISTSETITVESDSDGGSRENSSTIVDSKKIIMSSAQGGQQPLVIKEIVPKVEGVVIVAEGGDSVLVKEALINAANTVLGVEPHKVQVLKMK